MTDYSKCSTDDFDRILARIVGELPGSTIITIPGIYEILSEHFNNDVLEEWKNEQVGKLEETRLAKIKELNHLTRYFPNAEKDIKRLQLEIKEINEQLEK